MRHSYLLKEMRHFRLLRDETFQEIRHLKRQDISGRASVWGAVFFLRKGSKRCLAGKVVMLDSTCGDCPYRVFGFAMYKRIYIFLRISSNRGCGCCECWWAGQGEGCNCACWLEVAGTKCVHVQPVRSVWAALFAEYASK